MKVHQQQKQVIFFGYGLAVILLFIAGRLWLKHGWSAVNTALVFFAVLFIFITRFKLKLLKPVYDNWMKAAHVIGGVLTGVILCGVFYVLLDRKSVV